MNKFCKQCLITAVYIFFWIPLASQFSWGLRPFFGNETILYLKLVYLIPFILTFIFGFIFSKQDLIFFFTGSFIASLIQTYINFIDTSVVNNIDYLNANTYFPFTSKISFQVFTVAIIYYLGSLFNKSIISSTSELDINSQPDQSKEDDINDINDVNDVNEIYD